MYFIRKFRLLFPPEATQQQFSLPHLSQNLWVLSKSSCQGAPTGLFLAFCFHICILSLQENTGSLNQLCFQNAGCYTNPADSEDSRCLFPAYMLKILQVRLQQYVNCELPDVQAGFRKGRGTRDQIANIHWIIEKARVPEKHLFLLYWLCQTLWLCGSQ